ncbi:MAG: DUF1801 domain-containing protein [Holophagaceae bacterium]|nr:DUF1801 domain-containing protein [Holophagaceae bacterium]
MTIQDQIHAYLALQPEAKRRDMQALHGLMLELMPDCRLWFLDGKDETGKVISNPNIGYGFQVLGQGKGSRRDFYQIGISANTTGISVYVLGLKDKTHLARTYGKALGRARISGYCIHFKSLKEVDLQVLTSAIRDGIEQTSA